MHDEAAYAQKLAGEADDYAPDRSEGCRAAERVMAVKPGLSFDLNDVASLLMVLRLAKVLRARARSCSKVHARARARAHAHRSCA